MRRHVTRLIVFMSILVAVAASSAQARETHSYKLTVLRTAYCLSGHTATGRSVGPGIVATDPRVIPMHTRMFIPGYGYGFAEDTGSAVLGSHVDVWMASCAAAMRMTRYVTITVFR